MTISEMRLYLMSRYPSSFKWHEKVQNMPTRQVIAIYRKMMARELDGMMKVAEESHYHQIDMFEYMASLSQNNTEVKV